MVLKELCALRGVSGDEKRVRDYILEKVRPFATETRVDRAGNLIAFKRGTGENRRHVALIAHMDEVGMIALGAMDNGLIRYSTVGGIDPRVVVSKPVRIGDGEVPGVIGAKAIHLQSADERNHVLGHDELAIDIGAKDKKDAEKLVSPGDLISFDSRWVEFGDGLVKARALDDRIGCMVAMSILEGDYPCDVTYVFTVGEEIGQTGAAAGAFSVRPDAALILEATGANDLACEDEHLKVCRVKKGVAVSMMDHASIGDRDLYRQLHDIAMEESIPWQPKQFVSGSNDSAAFQRMFGARPVCVLSVPCRYIHSPSCVGAFADIEAQFRLVEAFLSRFE